ncbi:MAG: lysophospholipid acyltransferase family protein [Leptospiraceae bacterium]|nr:lysophospholipid acyltransferase family protein [Leptospiraceae bacterium]MDW7975039.1 lysophospholipid acyltransferase family protein [Leptospiraceae bacterium]
MKKILRSILEDLLVSLIVGYLKVLVKTSNVIILEKHNIESFLKNNQPFILSAWHCNAFGGSVLVQDMDLTIMISQSRDGELIDKVVKKFKNHSVRGSSHRGGIQALRQLIQLGKEGKRLVITPDGPTGPAFKVQSGIITLASKTGIPIIPFHYESTKQRLANSWDYHRIPFWFNTIFVRYGEPFYVPNAITDEELSHYSVLLESKMMENMVLTQEARDQYISNLKTR